MSEVRATNLTNNMDYLQTVTAQSNNTVFRNQLLGDASAPQSAKGIGNSSVDPNIKNSRLAKIKQNIIDIYKISLEQFNNLLKAALNMSEEDIFTCDDEKFQLIITSFKTALDKQSNGLNTQEDFETATAELKKIYEDSDSQKAAEKYDEVTEGKELLQFINEKTGKNYKSIKEIPDNELEDIIRHLIKKYVSSGNNDEKSNAEKSAFMKQLLSSLKKVSHEDYKRLYNAFLKVAPEADQNFAVLLRIIENLKKNKAEFEKFLKEDLATICQANNLNYEKIKGALLKIAEVIKDAELDDIDTLKALLESFDPQNIYKLYKAKQEKGEQLSEEEQQFINDYERIQDIKARQARGEQISEEDQKFLNEYKEKIAKKYKDLKQAILAAFAILDPEKTEQLISNVSEEEMKEIIEKIYDLYKSNPDYKLDIKTLDKITGGKFSSYEPASSGNGSASYTSNLGTTGNGVGYNMSSVDTMLTASQILADKRGELTNTEAPIQYTVDKPDDGKKSLASKMVETREGFSTYAKIFGWKKAAVEAGKQFQNVTQDVKSALDKYVADMFKNDKGLLGFASDCHNNSALIKGVIASRLDNENSIEKLNVDIDTKNQVKAEYKEKHKEEEEKKKEQA